MMTCIHCGHKHLYTLPHQHMKCASCRRKFSIKRLHTDEKIIHAFIENKTVLQASQSLQLHYNTVQKRFLKLRTKILYYLDEQYQKTSNSSEYDEYIYMKNKNIYHAQNFLTFIYENNIYNLMLPSLHKFRTYDKSDEELVKFLFLNKIAKLQSKHSRINEFWNYLERFLKAFKGVNSENFIYYLKEAEFKFNYSKKAQEEILLKLFYD